MVRPAQLAEEGTERCPRKNESRIREVLLGEWWIRNSIMWCPQRYELTGVDSVTRRRRRSVVQ